MHKLLHISAIALCGSLSAQVYLPATANPATTECNARNNYVFQRAASRGQSFYDLSEVGQGALIINSAAVRWDGTTPPGGGLGPYTMNLTVLVGTTNLSIGQVNGSITGSG
jgi:hypothetical protein